MTAERVTVNLTEKASTALRDTAELTGMNKTDVINRALQFYAWAEAQNARGSELRIVDRDGLVERVHVL